jgi:hypothetical protein
MTTRALPSFPVVGAAALAASIASSSAFADPPVPAGTVLPVRFTTSVSSASSRVEDRVLAVVRQDVRRNGRVVIPAGSELRGHVVSVRRPGKVKGRAYLAVRFDELEVDGRRYRIGTRTLAREAPPDHGRDAKIIGGTTGAGALIGGLADGRSGAAKGALIGGAAGTGVVLTNRGKQVAFPAGARYRLRLTRPVRIG